MTDFCAKLNQDLRYNEVTFIGTHNSYCNNSLTGVYDVCYSETVLNQHCSLQEQFQLGVRVFDIEVRKFPGIDGFIICHTSPWICWFFGKSDLTKLLCEIKNLAIEFPSEIITVLINSQYEVDDYDWYNTQIKNSCTESGLNDYIYDYNDTRKPDDSWPKLKDIIESKKNVMMLGLKGKQDFKDYYNYFQKSDGKVKKGWEAKHADDLSPDNLIIHHKSGANRLFFMYCKYSDGKWPYLWGGNPDCAKQANKKQTALPLAQKCNNSLSSEAQRVNCIWYDFVDCETESILDTVNSLN